MAGKIHKTDKVSLNADEKNETVLQGTKLENVPTGRPYRVDVFATASSSDVRHKLEADTDVAIQESAVAAQDRIPVVPDDHVESFLVEGGSKLFLTVEDTSGAAQTYYYRIVMRPVQG